LHFIDADTYWLYIRDSEHREYFRREHKPEPSD
jgi:hypothetical protein